MGRENAVNRESDYRNKTKKKRPRRISFLIVVPELENYNPIVQNKKNKKKKKEKNRKQKNKKKRMISSIFVQVKLGMRGGQVADRERFFCRWMWYESCAGNAQMEE